MSCDRPSVVIDEQQPYKASRPADTEQEADGSGSMDTENTTGGSFALSTKQHLGIMHNFRWSDAEQTHVDQAFSAQAILRKHQRGVNTSYLQQIITALRPGTTVPSAKHARMELLARCLLHLDLEPFEPNRKGLKKPSLPTACLRDAAKAWCDFHPMEKKETLQGLRENQPYTVVWQNLKR